MLDVSLPSQSAPHAPHRRHFEEDSNIEKVLSSMKKGSGYKQHARELIQAHRLRENA